MGVARNIPLPGADDLPQEVDAHNPMPDWVEWVDNLPPVPAVDDEWDALPPGNEMHEEDEENEVWEEMPPWQFEDEMPQWQFEDEVAKMRARAAAREEKDKELRNEAEFNDLLDRIFGGNGVWMPTDDVLIVATDERRPPYDVKPYIQRLHEHKKTQRRIFESHWIHYGQSIPIPDELHLNRTLLEYIRQANPYREVMRTPGCFGVLEMYTGRQTERVFIPYTNYVPQEFIRYWKADTYRASAVEMVVEIEKSSSNVCVNRQRWRRHERRRDSSETQLCSP